MTPIPAGWKPIESAPKDGTPVLLFARHIDATASTVVVGSFDNNGFGWIAQCYVGQSFARLVPSHWMERPGFPDTPPATTQDDPITVSLDPDPRGVSVGVWQGSSCIYTGAHAVPASVAPGDAQNAVIAGALFDLMGFLTTLDEPVALGSTEEAAIAVELLQFWAAKRGLNLDGADVKGWKERLTAPAAGDALENGESAAC